MGKPVDEYERHLRVVTAVEILTAAGVGDVPLDDLPMAVWDAVADLIAVTRPYRSLPGPTHVVDGG